MKTVSPATFVSPRSSLDCIKENSPELIAKFDALLRFRLEILPTDRTTWSRFARMKANQELSGEPVDDLDLLIAAVAVQHDLILAPLNTRHFSRIKGLRREDWSK